MQQQAGVLFYKFRFALAGILIIAIIVLISALVTTIGSGTILAKNKFAPSAGNLDLSVENPNDVVVMGAKFAAGAQRSAISAGRGLYKTCKSITVTSVATSKATLHGVGAGLHDTWNGIAFAGHGVASVTILSVRTATNAYLLPYRVPGKVASALGSGNPVGSILQPAADKPVPVISSETSAATLASFNEQQRQQIASWQAAQLAANQQLEGLVVAGDPAHGGYPANWDNAAQDSTLDKWGMYNRECVSYAAWKVYQTYGDMPYWGGVGNANQWLGDARRAGIATGSTPQVHSVAISMRGYYGHAMWVEKVQGDMIYVSQYNYDLHGHYSEMWVNASYFSYIYFK